MQYSVKCSTILSQLYGFLTAGAETLTLVDTIAQLEGNRYTLFIWSLWNIDEQNGFLELMQLVSFSYSNFSEISLQLEQFFATQNSNKK